MNKDGIFKDIEERIKRKFKVGSLSDLTREQWESITAYGDEWKDLPYQFLDPYIGKTGWLWIVRKQKMPEDFILKHFDGLNLFSIIESQNLSPLTVEKKFTDYLSSNVIFKNPFIAPKLNNIKENPEWFRVMLIITALNPFKGFDEKEINAYQTWHSYIKYLKETETDKNIFSEKLLNTVELALKTKKADKNKIFDIIKRISKKFKEAEIKKTEKSADR